MKCLGKNTPNSKKVKLNKKKTWSGEITLLIYHVSRDIHIKPSQLKKEINSNYHIL
jgi:hypothetical protein